MNLPGCERERESTAEDEVGLDLLLRQLQEDMGLDLRQYKPNYLRRRIGVRMRAAGCSDYLEYRRLVRRDREEGGRLINDLTINVTEFFRDEDVYAVIREEVIPRLIRDKRESGTRSLRAWSAGCASGEEPYSLSVLFLDALSRERDAGEWALRITATDLDDKAIAKAREGVYESVKMPPGLLLDDYFEPREGGLAVKEGVGRPVRFLCLDIMQRPPLRHLDLILCRNVLIYFEREKQQHILEIFKRCLRPGGFLVLGKSEAILGAGGGGLLALNRRERVYRKESSRPRGANAGSAGAEEREGGKAAERAAGAREGGRGRREGDRGDAGRAPGRREGRAPCGG